MSIKILSGNIFDSDCQALVNPVNCLGHSGKGLALEFKRRFPDSYLQFRLHCDKGLMEIGTVFTSWHSPGKRIIHFPTKGHWRNPSNLQSVHSGLNALRHEIRHLKIHSIAIPALGCGYGGLDWKDVKPLILGFMKLLKGIEVEIYEPLS